MYFVWQLKDYKTNDMCLFMYLNIDWGMYDMKIVLFKKHCRMA